MSMQLNEKGAVLNKANRSLLQQAYDMLKNVLAIPNDDDDDADTKEAKGFSQTDLAATLQRELAEQMPDCRLVDIFPDDSTVVYAKGWYDASYWQVSYTVDNTGVASFSDPIEVTRKVSYVATSDSKPSDPMMSTESAVTIESDVIPLLEKAVNNDGITPIKIIAPGWGSSAYYPADVLKRDGPNVFKAGTQMFWDHQTPTEESQRPEGSLTNLAAVLIEDAHWSDSDPSGAGLYARARVRSEFTQPLNDLGPHIGVSIRATGKAKVGTIEGRQGPILEAFNAAKSVDFVTQAGAGGRVLELFESVRGSISMADNEEITRLKEANAALQARLDRIEVINNARNAKELIEATLNEDQYRLIPTVAKSRMLARYSESYPTDANGMLDTVKLSEAVVSEAKAWLDDMAASGTFGRIRNVGASSTANTNDDAFDKELADEFKALGMSESAANTAVKGREVYGD